MVTSLPFLSRMNKSGLLFCTFMSVLILVSTPSSPWKTIE
jgi:hypothetical protein